MISANMMLDLLLENQNKEPLITSATAFAPINIAFIKYWGKRDTALNLPITSSLSLTLPKQGTETTVSVNNLAHDRYYLNGVWQDPCCEFSKRLQQFCQFFRFEKNIYFDIHTHNHVPTAAGLASSASGFAALVLAFDQLFQWQLSKTHLSLLARLGSGSACRSLWPGFVEWQKGELANGLDSYAIPYNCDQEFLTSLRLGLLLVDKEKKLISSRQAMLNSVKTSPSYRDWPKQVEKDMAEIKKAIDFQNFIDLGAIAERNAITMHASMFDSTPATNYCLAQTYAYREKIWDLRKAGLSVYFTQDAGPNLKVIAMEKDWEELQAVFPEMLTMK